MNEDIVAMEGQVHVLCETLDELHVEEQKLCQRVQEVESELLSIADMTHLRGITEMAANIKKELESSLIITRSTLEGLVGQTILNNSDEEKERAILVSFNEDVERIYNNFNAGIEEMRTDLDRVIRKQNSPRRLKR
jgi:hypothetical protein